MTTMLSRESATAAQDAGYIPRDKSDARSHMAFRPDIEGMRALGVLLVVAFHAAVPGLDGGFVGVDVFFVISGFLITSLLLREAAATGRISLQDFYARRARRILPAACVVLAVTAVTMPLFLDPLTSYRSILDLGAALFYVSNWRFIHQNNDYLAASTDQSPVLHFWSLSVEEQFYFVWPMLVVLALGLASRRRWGRRGTTFSLGLTLGGISAISLALAVGQTTTNPNLAYMATTTRAWQFGVGGLVAVWLATRDRATNPMRGRRRGLLIGIGVFGLLAIATAAALFGRQTPYPGWAALVPTLGAAALIVAGSGGTVGVSRWLCARPIRWVGRVSYPWYLWHWPAIVFALAVWPDLGLFGRVTVMLVALGLAWVTNLAVERPLVQLGALRSRGRSALVGLLVTVLAGSGLLMVGLDSRAKLDRQAADASATLPSTLSVFGRDSGPNAGAVRPSPLTASADVAKPASCLGQARLKTPTECVIGPSNGPDVVMFGDSHMQQWQSPLMRIAASQGWRLHMVAQGGCPAADFRGSESLALPESCRAWRSYQLSEINRLKPMAVILSSQSRYGTSAAGVASAWHRTFTQLRGSGARLIFLRDTALPPSDIPSCVAAHLNDWNACAFSASDKQSAMFAAWELAAVQHEGVGVISVTGTLCPDGICPAVRNHVLLYRDESHISDTAARILEPWLDTRLVTTLARTSPSPPAGVG